MKDFGRLITAMVTPFTGTDAVDYKEAVRLANYLAAHGTQTILLTGTTGESPTLTHDEEFELFRIIRENLSRDTFLMAGTGSNCTKTAIVATQKAERLGMDCSLQVVPYYNKPSQEGLYQHFKAIADATRLPIILYNIPGRTSRNMEPETIARLSEIKNIIGIKEAAGNADQVAKIRSLTPSEFIIWSGDDALTLDFMEKGAYGVISVAAHCAGLQIRDMIEKFASGQKEAARKIEADLKALFEVLFINTNPAPVKAALNMMGFNVGHTRLPLVDATSAEQAKIHAVLEKTGILEQTPV